MLQDAIIIGNGVLGMSLARALAKLLPEIRLTVVGPRARTGSASLAAGAMLNSWAELETGALDDPTLAVRFSLSRRALDLWDNHAAALSEESGQPLSLTWGTTVFLNANSPAQEELAFKYLLFTLARERVQHQPLPGLEFPGVDPAQRPRQAVRIPDGRVDSRKVIGALETILDRLPDCKRVDDVAVRLEARPSGDKIVTLSQGDTLVSKTVVLANGAYAQTLIDRVPALRHSVPRLMFGAGSAFDLSFRPNIPFPPELAELDTVLRTLDRGGGCGMHLVPQGHRSFYFGASSSLMLQPDDQPRVHGLSVLVNGLVREFHHAFANAGVALRGPGFRPVTLDAFPLLGESAVDGIWFCNGTKRDGFTCSPLLAREIAQGISGRRCDLPDLFQPSRRLISYRQRPQAIHAAVSAALASDSLNGLRLPPHRQAEWECQEQQRITQIYDKRGIREFGIHPEMLHLYDSDQMYHQLFENHD